MKSANERNGGSEANEGWLEIVRRHVSSLNFGVVQIVVHGGRVVQIEKTEKVRISDPIATAPEQI